jgi:hypothetical protein
VEKAVQEEKARYIQKLESRLHHEHQELQRLKETGLVLIPFVYRTVSLLIPFVVLHYRRRSYQIYKGEVTTRKSALGNRKAKMDAAEGISENTIQSIVGLSIL